MLLGRFSQRQEERFVKSCCGVDDPLERVYCWIDLAVEGFRNPDMKGCLVGTFAQEISETHPELCKVCQCAFEGFATSVGQDLLAAKALHAPQAEFDAASLGNYFLSIAQGSMLVLRTTGDRAAMAGNLIHFKQYLQSLYGR